MNSLKKIHLPIGGSAYGIDVKAIKSSSSFCVSLIFPTIFPHLIITVGFWSSLIELSSCFHEKKIYLQFHQCFSVDEKKILLVKKCFLLRSFEHKTNIKVEKILKSNFKVWVGKFASGVKAKHCWALSRNIWKQKACWHHPAMFCLFTFPWIIWIVTEGEGDEIESRLSS